MTLVTVIFRRNANGRPRLRATPPLNPTINAHIGRETFPHRRHTRATENDGITKITTKFSTNYSLALSLPRSPPSHSLLPLSLSFSFAISLPFSLFFFCILHSTCLTFLYSAHPICPSVPRGKIGPALFLLVIFVHMPDTDSVRTPAAFALIELFLTCPRRINWPCVRATYARGVEIRRNNHIREHHARASSHPFAGRENDLLVRVAYFSIRTRPSHIS